VDCDADALCDRYGHRNGSRTEYRDADGVGDSAADDDCDGQHHFDEHRRSHTDTQFNRHGDRFTDGIANDAHSDALEYPNVDRDAVAHRIGTADNDEYANGDDSAVADDDHHGHAYRYCLRSAGGYDHADTLPYPAADRDRHSVADGNPDSDDYADAVAPVTVSNAHRDRNPARSARVRRRLRRER